MPKHDAFIEDFEKLLAKIPEHYSLAQWQYAYRNVLYSMGLKILENFPQAVVGPDPSAKQGTPPEHAEMMMLGGGPPGAIPAGSGGSTGGHRPNILCQLTCTILQL
jgi:hypothetical protein